VPEAISLKCDPDLAIELRLQFAAVNPGYHLNKRHWNTVHLDGTIPDDDVVQMVTHSYQQVVAGLPKSVRASLLA
jgi:predicted DNA-binding protein (MmcQ/YjbR family)